MKKTRNTGLSFFLSIIFSLIVVGYVFYNLDWMIIRSTLASLHWGWLFLALLVFWVNYILRALRFRVLIPAKNIPFVQLLAITGLYGMYNYLLPAKSGELSYVVLVNRRLNVSLVDSTTSLIAARYLDFATIALILPFVLIIFMKSMPLWLIYASLTFCSAVFIGSVLIYYFFKQHSIQANRPKSFKYIWIAKIYKVLTNLQDGLIKIYNRREHMSLLLLTILIWLCVYTNFYLIVVSLGYQLNYFQIVVISIFMIPMTLLPIQGFANLGTHEIGWVAAFSVFGQPEEVALSAAISSHIILLFFVLLLGAGSFLVTLLVRICPKIS